jgi:formate dehydrogenase maturation protein FdhE
MVEVRRRATAGSLVEEGPCVETRCYSCPSCGSDEVNSSVKTNDSIYCRCRRCGEVWQEFRTEPPPRGPYRRRRGDDRMGIGANPPEIPPGEDEAALIDTPRCPFCLTADGVTLAEAEAPWWDARFFTCSRCGTEWAIGPLFSDRRRAPRKTDA